ncbi:MAG: DUF3805 domain-containing protein [Eubacteriales bacterium]
MGLFSEKIRNENTDGLKVFKSRYYQLKYPKEWICEKHRDITEFYNPNGKSTFRVSHMKLSNKVDPDKIMSEKELLDMYISDYKDAEIVEFPTKKAIYFKEYTKDVQYDLIICYWLVCKNNILLNCSYTILKDDEDKEKTRLEYAQIKKIFEDI